MPLGNWEGQRRDERSQETCLCGESQARCTQADISASLPAARPCSRRGVAGWKRESGCGSTAALTLPTSNTAPRTWSRRG